MYVSIQKHTFWCIGDYENRNIYIKLEHNFGIIKNIYCGGFHTILINDNDEIFGCGSNASGQLGFDDETQDYDSESELDNDNPDQYYNHNIFTRLNLPFDSIKKYFDDDHKIKINDDSIIEL